MKILSLSPNMYENWAVSLTVKSGLCFQLNWRRKNSLVCSFDAAFLPNVVRFECLRNCEPCLTPEKNYSNQRKLLWPKYRETKLKSTKKTDFLSSEGQLLTSPGCCLTLAFSLDVVQDRFASWSVYRVLLGNDLSNLLVVSVLSQKCNACTFRLLK